MADIDKKEVQRTLDEINKRVTESQSGKIYSSSSFSLSYNLKLIFTIIGVAITLIISAIFYTKNSENKIDTNKNYRSATFIFNNLTT